MIVPARIAASLVIVTVAGILVTAGRATGAITIVAYDSGQITQWGITHEKENWPGFGLPVRLRLGEALRATYRVDAPVGALNLQVRSPSTPGRTVSRPKPASVRVSGEGTGTMLFIAQETGFHGYSNEPGVLGGNGSCLDREASVASAIVPQRGCPTLDVGYTVSWHYVSAEEVVRSNEPRILVPRQDGEVIFRDVTAGQAGF